MSESQAYWALVLFCLAVLLALGLVGLLALLGRMNDDVLPEPSKDCKRSWHKVGGSQSGWRK